MQKKKSNGSSMLSEVQLEEIAKLFKILSEPARLKLISSLMAGGLTVSELVDQTGLKQGNVSKHMKILLDAGLVQREKEGNFVRYSIAEPMLFELCQLVCAQVENAAAEKLKCVKGQ
ncbi:ArsR/SmtB family transcription factor [Rubritalea spongiae]|uniref:ArsR/SmtB family transcription factor n=1 Tax=Rubritalea spongiae TaxID=430797 RepID=A0ABW5E420_9BACT